jgi:hypothetical protein
MFILSTLSPTQPAGPRTPPTRKGLIPGLGQTIKSLRTFRDRSSVDPTLRDRFVVTPSIPRGEDRPTIPAPASFEEAQFELVRRGLRSIDEAQIVVSAYREKRNASAARLIGGAL